MNIQRRVREVNYTLFGVGIPLAVLGIAELVIDFSSVHWPLGAAVAGAGGNSSRPVKEESLTLGPCIPTGSGSPTI
jgi:hypothetical protein